MLNKLGNIIVMGLAVRQDRWNRCVEIFKHFNISEYKHYEMFARGENRWMQYAEDTLTMLSETPGTIVYLEDDFELIEGFEEALQKAVKDLPIDWDILYLGCNPTTELHKITPNLCRVMGAWGTFAYVINEPFKQYILQNWKPNECVVLDEWLRINAPEHNYFMPLPMVADTRPTFSDIMQTEVDYNLMENVYLKRVL